MWVRSQLTAAEYALWRTQQVADQRHTAQVGRAFVRLRPSAGRAEVAGALLHDIGKTAARLGTVGRVLATLAGPRTTRWAQYLDHESVGAAMLGAVDSAPDTVRLVAGEPSSPALADLRRADDLPWARSTPG